MNINRNTLVSYNFNFRKLEEGLLIANCIDERMRKYPDKPWDDESIFRIYKHLNDYVFGEENESIIVYTISKFMETHISIPCRGLVSDERFVGGITDIEFSSSGASMKLNLCGDSLYLLLRDQDYYHGRCRVLKITPDNYLSLSSLFFCT